METQYHYILRKIEEAGWTIAPCEECNSSWWVHEMLIVQKGENKVYLTFIYDDWLKKVWCAGLSGHEPNDRFEACSAGEIDITGGWKERVEEFIYQLNALHKNDNDHETL